MCVATGSHFGDALLGAATVGTSTAAQASTGKMHAQKKKNANPFAVPETVEPTKLATPAGRKTADGSYTNAPDPSIGLQIH